MRRAAAPTIVAFTDCTKCGRNTVYRYTWMNDVVVTAIANDIVGSGLTLLVVKNTTSARWMSVFTASTRPWERLQTRSEVGCWSKYVRLTN